MTNLELLEKKCRTAFTAAGIPAQYPVILKEAVRPEFGDYQINGVMSAAKAMGMAPHSLATLVTQTLAQDSTVAKAEVAGAGFINITLTTDYIAEHLNGTSLTKIANQQPLTVIIDYSSPNLSKEMHVGHLRSTIIGDALVRLHEFIGNIVIRRNHVGDWGTQFGMLLAHLAELQQAGENSTSLELADLEDFYRQAKVRFDSDSQFAARARAFVVKLQAGDAETLTMWQQFLSVSLQHCQAIYQRLGVKLKESDVFGESYYNPLLPWVIKHLAAKGLIVDSDGAKCLFFTPEELGTEDDSPFIVQKQDGGYLYATTDVAAVYDRVHNLQGQWLIYVVDARQTLHLKQLFLTVRKAQLVNDSVRLEHVAFGTMMGKDRRPFKTRLGGTVKLATLLEESVLRAKNFLTTRHSDWSPEQINEVAEKIGIGAVKYADLSKNRICDYIFSYDQMLALEGNTAPYLLYAYVRINSLFEKTNIAMEELLRSTTSEKIKILGPYERSVALQLLKFTDVVKQAALESHPHYLCTYLYNLASLFMQFYEHCPILQEAATIKNNRLRLAALTAQVLASGLGILGISVVHKM